MAGQDQRNQSPAPAQASERIDALQAKTGRGKGS